MKKILENRYYLIGISVIIGLIIGWLIKPSGSRIQGESDHQQIEASDDQIWTCSMHPQIQRNEPGNCPICGMELIPLQSDEDESGEEGKFSVKLSKASMKIAEVEMSTIEKKSPYKEIYLPGKVMADERKISELTSRLSGRIEKLYINFTGQKVKKGQILAKIYSPELVSAQRELFEAMKFRDKNPGFYNAARNKLKLWDLTDEQINEIEESGEVDFYFDVLSPITGTVTDRHVTIGDYVKEGAALFEVVDLSHVWVMFDAYENDIPWIKLGDKIKFSIRSIPGIEFESRVTFIDPVLDRMSRVAGVRGELSNPNDLLKPQMLATGILKTMLPGSGPQLVVKKSSVLWTGKKAVVYVMTGDQNNLFQYREIELGAEAGDYYVVKSGLEEGEKVATNGVFKIDAAAQLKGVQSMMNPEGGKVSLGMAGMDMGSDNSTDIDNTEELLDDTSEKKIKIDMSVDFAFKRQLTSVYEAQLSLQDAFIDSNPEEVKKTVATVETEIGNVDMSLVKGEMHNRWMTSLKMLKESLEKIKSSEDIEIQRFGYADFSDALYEAIKMFGTVGETIYYQFCPMARNGEGAFWLSPVKEIKNPYYGETMLTCGETIEVIE